MPSGFELTTDHYAALDANQAAIKTMRQYGESKAKKEAAYNVALATKIAELRTKGNPAGLCEKLAKGTKEVSEVYIAWQCEEALYTAAKEHVQLTKRRADAIRDQIQREYTQAGWRA